MLKHDTARLANSRDLLATGAVVSARSLRHLAISGKRAQHVPFNDQAAAVADAPRRWLIRFGSDTVSVVPVPSALSIVS